MTGISFQIEFEEGTDARAAAKRVRERVAALDAVREADVEPSEQMFSPAEAAVVLAGAVLVAKQGRLLVAEVRKLLDEIVGLARDVRGYRRAFVEIGHVRVPVDELSEAHLEQIAAAGPA